MPLLFDQLAEAIWPQPDFEAFTPLPALY